LPKVYLLPEGLRTRLARPMGRLFSAEEVKGQTFAEVVRKAPMVITVGDRVTETLGARGRVPDVQVVDSRENRKGRTPPGVAYARRIEVTNPPGTITEGAIDGIREALRGQKPARVAVEGEEDLLALPVIALAPVSALVFYGQPGEGIVVVRADAESKSRNRAILAEIGISEIR
jgi:GTP-dependent dephospho-CoA kinase